MLKLQNSLKAACMAAAALVVFGCSQDEWAGQSAGKGNTTIVASFEGAGAGTRTSVNEMNQVVWNQGDAFGLFYTAATPGKAGATAAKFTYEGESSTTGNATFTGNLEDGVTTSYAVYPYQEGMTLAGTTVTMKLPATLAYTEASNGPMYAKATDINESLQFKHLAGLLKLTVSKGITTAAKKFVITASNNIAGTCTADLNTANPALAVSTDGGKTITVTLNIKNNDTENITTFYLPIPVGTYESISATLLGEANTPLFPAKTWNSVVVTRAGMLTASYGYVKIAAETEDAIKEAIVAALPTKAPEAAITTELDITSEIDATKGEGGIASIEIPVFQNSNVSMALAAVPVTSEAKPLVLKDNDTQATTPVAAKNTVTVTIPKVTDTDKAPNFTITMPQSTVELTASGSEGTTYGKVIAKTANNTLVIKKGVTVNKLVVEGGNIRVGGEIKAIEKAEGLSGTTIYIYKEEGAVLPTETPEGFEVVDAAVFDIKKALANGRSITLTSNVDITDANIIVPEGKTSTLDLNGYTVTANNKSGEPTEENKSGRITVKGNFTLKDSKGGGKIVANKDYENKIYDSGVIIISGENAHMTMESGEVYAVRDDAANKGQYGIVLGSGGDFTMTGGKITAGWYAVSGNGNYKTQNSVINIQGGELISTADYALYLPQAGTTTISGGKVNGACGGVAMQRGTLNISGTAQILSTDESNTGQWTDGTGNLGNAAIIVNARYGDCTLNISGGTISSLKQAALIENNTSASFKRTINITGGTFSDPSALAFLGTNANVKIAMNADKTGKGFITQSGQKVEIDMGTHTLTLAGPTVGSAGTETNSCQLLEGSEVTFKNGKVTSENTYIMIQNYCKLLLDNVTVEATKADYVVSNNNESCTITNSTITAGKDKCAFDVCSFNDYTGVTVTVNTGSTINGKVELGGNNKKKSGKLIVNGGTFNGNLVVTEAYYNSEDPNILIYGGSFGEFTGWDKYKVEK